MKGVDEIMSGMFVNSYFPNPGSAAGAAAGRKLSLPVEPHFLIYSHLKNVSGVPASEGSQGVAISRLNVLDVLIEQMNKIKTPPVSQSSSQNSPKPGQLDAMLEAFKAQFREVKTAGESMPYIPAPQAPSGVLVKISA